MKVGRPIITPAILIIAEPNYANCTPILMRIVGDVSNKLEGNGYENISTD